MKTIINTSYQKLPFGSGDCPDKLLFHQAPRNAIITQGYNPTHEDLEEKKMFLKSMILTVFTYFCWVGFALGREIRRFM